jgi:hypothetical protein
MSERAIVRRGWTALLLAAAAFSLSLFFNTRHNQFPFGYHPDEPTKTEQILSTDGFRNFLHPQLLLECTQRAVDWGGTPRNTQAVAVVGRDVSAVFAAAAVAAACGVGFLCGGIVGEALLGISLLCCCSLIVYAHYFKEDAALAMGLLLVLLATRCAIDATSRRAAWASAIFVGFACAVAASAKYVGLFFLIAGLAAVLAAPAERWRYRLGRAAVVLVCFVLFAAAINYRGLKHFSDFKGAFEDEVEHSISSHFGLTMHRPNTFFIRTLPAEATWWILALAVLAVPILIYTRNRRNAWDFIVMAIGPAFLILLSFSVIPFQRYLLPVVLMIHVTAALAALWLMGEFPRQPGQRVLIAAMFSAVFLSVGVPRCASALRQFGDDSRDRFRAWAIANLPPNTRIATDFYVGLLTQENFHRLPVTKTIGNRITVEVVRSGPDLGSIQALRLEGFSYVAVADMAYERFFSPEVRALPDSQDWLADRVQWYDDLFHDYPLVWRSDPDLVLHAYTNPAIRVYRIDSPAH